MTQLPDKDALRRRMRAVRRRLAAEVANAGARAAQALPLDRFAEVRTAAAYVAQGSEIDPEPLVRRLLEAAPISRRAALPATPGPGQALSFRFWTPGQPLVPDAYGIASPPPEAGDARPDLVITPLLAFDRRGGRLGQGGGHYDRTLENLRARGSVYILGLAYAGQELDDIPMDLHDQRLDGILTETGFFEVAKEAR